MVALTWSVTAALVVGDALRTTDWQNVGDYVAAMNLFSLSYFIVSLYMMFCWTRAMLEARRGSVTAGPDGIEIVDWRNTHLVLSWDEVERVASLDYGGFCKPPRVLLYGRGNFVYEFSPWLVSSETLLEHLVERAGLTKRARTWSRQFWT
jgi:hypothetical protein